MMKYFLLLFSVVVIIACNSKKAIETKKDSIVASKDSTAIIKHNQPTEYVAAINLDSVKQVILKQSSNSTKIYIFSLEGDFSAEGNEGKAFYKNNIISKIELTFYGESGKNVYIYQFKNNKVEVIQQSYGYKTNFMEVKSEKDIIKGEKIEFSTDLEGKVITGNNAEADLDTFYELKKAVPFDLN